MKRLGALLVFAALTAGCSSETASSESPSSTASDSTTEGAVVTNSSATSHPGQPDTPNDGDPQIETQPPIEIEVIRAGGELDVEPAGPAVNGDLVSLDGVTLTIYGDDLAPERSIDLTRLVPDLTPEGRRLTLAMPWPNRLLVADSSATLIDLDADRAEFADDLASSLWSYHPTAVSRLLARADRSGAPSVLDLESLAIAETPGDVRLGAPTIAPGGHLFFTADLTWSDPPSVAWLGSATDLRTPVWEYHLPIGSHFTVGSEFLDDETLVLAISTEQRPARTYYVGPLEGPFERLSADEYWALSHPAFDVTPSDDGLVVKTLDGLSTLVTEPAGSEPVCSSHGIAAVHADNAISFFARDLTTTKSVQLPEELRGIDIRDEGRFNTVETTGVFGLIDCEAERYVDLEEHYALIAGEAWYFGGFAIAVPTGGPALIMYEGDEALLVVAGPEGLWTVGPGARSAALSPDRLLVAVTVENQDGSFTLQVHDSTQASCSAPRPWRLATSPGSTAEGWHRRKLRLFTIHARSCPVLVSEHCEDRRTDSAMTVGGTKWRTSTAANTNACTDHWSDGADSTTSRPKALRRHSPNCWHEARRWKGRPVGSGSQRFGSRGESWRTGRSALPTRFWSDPNWSTARSRRLWWSSCWSS